MGKFKAILIVLLLVAPAAGGTFYGLNLLYQQKAFADADQHLEGASQQVLNNMRVKSFESIQALQRIAGNAELISALRQSPSTEGKNPEEVKTAIQGIHDQLSDQMESLVKASLANHLQIINSEGLLIAQKPGDEFGISLKGLPAVKDCLAGMSRDAIQEEDQSLFLVAVAPVRTANGQMIGCLLDRRELNAAMVKPLSQNPNIDLALFKDKEVKASTIEKNALKPLGQLLDSEELIRFGEPNQPLPLLINLKGQGYLANSLKLQLGAGDAHLVTIVSMGPRFEALHDLQMKVIYGAGALFVFGLLLAFVFSGNKDHRQLLKLQDAVRVATETNNSANIFPDDFSGVAHFIAIDLKRLVAAKAKTTAGIKIGSSDVGDLLGRSSDAHGQETHDSEPEPDKLDFDGLLGERTEGEDADIGASPVQFPQPSTSKPAPPPPPAAKPQAPKPVAPAPKPAPQDDDSKGPKVEMPGDLASFFDDEGNDDSTREVDAVIPAAALPDMDEMPKLSYPAPSPIREAPDRSAPPPTMGFEDFPPDLDMGDDDDDQITSGDYRPDATVVAQVPDALLKAATTDEDDSDMSPSAPLPKPPVMPAPVPPPPVSPMGAASSDDMHFAEVFDKFLQAKKQCGEPIAGLTKDKFLEKLRKNTSDLKNRYNCSTVRFQVYVKNGKAALKATPIK